MAREPVTPASARAPETGEEARVHVDAFGYALRTAAEGDPSMNAARAALLSYIGGLREERDEAREEAESFRLMAENRGNMLREARERREAAESSLVALREALEDAAGLIESARVLAIHNGNRSSEAAFDAGRKRIEAALPRPSADEGEATKP